MGLPAGAAVAMPDGTQLVDFIFDRTAEATAFHVFLLLTVRRHFLAKASVGVP